MILEIWDKIIQNFYRNYIKTPRISPVDPNSHRLCILYNAYECDNHPKSIDVGEKPIAQNNHKMRSIDTYRNYIVSAGD